MSSVAEVFDSGPFQYVYTFELEPADEPGSPYEIYELSRRRLTDADLALKKQMIAECYSLAVVNVKIEQLK